MKIMASLVSFNDDCLRKILEYCDTNDHVELVIAFEQFKPIVQDILKKFWRTLCLAYDFQISYVHNDANNPCPWRGINSQRPKIVLDLIQPFVEEIQIIGQNKEMWDIINETQFAKATKLHLHQTFTTPVVKSCFPNLRSLVLEGDSVVEYNPEWNGLENFETRYSDMRVSEIMEFISQLKLKKFTFDSFEQPISEQYRNYEYLSELEEISGSNTTMKKLANAFNIMHKLRKVSVKNIYPDLDKNISLFSKILGIRTVEFFTIYDDDINFENRLQELPNLKRLAVECSNIKRIQMLLRSRHLHLLKAIILKDIRIDAEILTNILISVPELELLDFDFVSMDSTIHLDLASIAQKRSKPVTINLQPTININVEPMSYYKIRI